MFNHQHYVPILKGRDGEYGALQTLSPDVKKRLTPLLEVPPIAWDFGEDRPAKTVDEHLAKVSTKIERAWGLERPLFVDLLWIPEVERMADGSHPAAYVFQAAQARGLKLVPVTGLARDQAYQLAVRDHAAQERSCCIRLQMEDFVDPQDVSGQLETLLSVVGLAPTQVDLVMDLRALTSTHVATLLITVPSLLASLPRLEDWRSLTLAATAFPENLMGLPPSDVSVIRRIEWALWKSVVARSKMAGRLPTFGDYAIAHPAPSEVDPRIMRASASIRYTMDEDWLVVKARSLRDHGFNQFHEVCRTLVACSEYSGKDFSWGDRYIDECARNQTGPGNLTSWRKVGTSHHLTFVTAQLASLVWP